MAVMRRFTILKSWYEILKDATWFHWTGITPALSQNAADECLKAIQAANELGVTVSCDINYRGNLWNYGKDATIDDAEADELDTDRLTLCIGLFSYAAAFCIPSFDAKSFRRLFVLAWFKYFSTVLSLENNDAPAGKGFIS